MYSDCHIHTSFSGDSDEAPENQIDKAISLGMKHICFTDHHDYAVESECDFNLDFERYFEKLTVLKEKYADRIDISVGVELGLQTKIADYLDELAKKYTFDFIIGSVHFIDGYDPYYDEYFAKYGSDAYKRYFDVTLECLEKIKCFDSFGHLDYVVRYGSKHGLSYSYEMYADSIDKILCLLIADNKALECNSGGLVRGLSEPNPCTDILKRYYELGGRLITLGSDAHSADLLGCEFAKCGEILKSAGFFEYAVYKNRKYEMISL